MHETHLTELPVGGTALIHERIMEITAASKAHATDVCRLRGAREKCSIFLQKQSNNIHKGRSLVGRFNVVCRQTMKPCTADNPPSRGGVCLYISL